MSIREIEHGLFGVGRIVFEPIRATSTTWHVPMPRPKTQGWECPKCGAVMAPQTAACLHCRPKRRGVHVDTTTDPCTVTEEGEP